MKNFILKIIAVVIAFSSIVSCKDKAADMPENIGYTISGTVKGLESGSIKMMETGPRERSKIVTIDSTHIVNGAFEFEGVTDKVDMVSLIVDSKYHGRFMLENSAIKVDIDVSDLNGRNMYYTPVVTGSKSHDQYATVEAQSKAVMEDPKYKALEEVRELFILAKKTNKKEDLEKAENLQKELIPLSKERMDRYKETKFDFVRNNPNSPVAVHVMGYQYTEGRMTKDQLKEFYNLFKGDARETGFFKHYITKVYKDNFENLGVGNTAPDFTLNTVEGNEQTLSKVNAKYKLVDFWASWCIPCRASFPHLKELREQYKKDGFEVVGVGTADLEDKWRKAIEEDQTPWIHVYDAGEGRMYGPVAKKYGVPHLPTTFLVDAKNTILLRNPTKEELDNKLKELFGH
ncbi:redoxin family protein [Seonamhaeicola maritimus]|uniref:redoxin family protein n=1 Tax=Seonamhaeicola maritimus TaxID=2591822 RepID=UPI002495A026|nr:redoxin family protein [Seonamhaeicola maritimus]